MAGSGFVKWDGLDYTSMNRFYSKAFVELFISGLNTHLSFFGVYADFF